MSAKTKTKTKTKTTNVAAGPGYDVKAHLRSVVERIERLEEEKKALASDISDVYLEAKGNGFDVKVLRIVIRMRKQDKDERTEQESILDTYLVALGMTPLEEAIARAVA